MDITDETSGETLYQAEDTVKDVVQETHDASNDQKMPPPSQPQVEAPTGDAPTGTSKRLHETA